MNHIGRVFLGDDTGIEVERAAWDVGLEFKLNRPTLQQRRYIYFQIIFSLCSLFVLS